MLILSLLLLVLNFSSAKAEEIEKVIKAKSGSSCALTKNLEIKDLKDTAGIIFRGKFVDIQEIEENNLAVRKLRFLIREPIKGIDSRQKSVILTEAARIKSPFALGMIASNKEYVFFFHEPSKLGLTSLVGVEQGAIEIERQGQLKPSKRLKMQKARNKRFLIFSFQNSKLENYKDLKEFLQN